MTSKYIASGGFFSIPQRKGSLRAPNFDYGYPTPCNTPPLEQREDPISSCHVLPKIAKLDLNDYQDDDDLVEDIIASLKTSGGCIIRNIIDENVLSSLDSEIGPFLRSTDKAQESRDEFVPSTTRMVTGLLSKSPTYGLNIVGNPVWQKVGEYFLTSRLSNFWHGDKSRSSISKPQLSTTVAFSVQPGTKAQSLHRDDDIYHSYHPARSEHVLGRDTMVCFFVAGTRTTRANGATRIVPGSHLWDFSAPPPSADDPTIDCAELEPGDGFMMLGGCFHGAGANTTLDQERRLANDLQKIRELPEWLQRFAGFGASKPFMGWVDMEEPIKVLGGPHQRSKPTDFW